MDPTKPPHPFTNTDEPFKPPGALERPRNGDRSGDALRVDRMIDRTGGGKVRQGLDGFGPVQPAQPTIPARQAPGVGPAPRRLPTMPDDAAKRPRGRGR